MFSFEGVAVWAVLNGAGRFQAELNEKQLATLGLVRPSIFPKMQLHPLI